MLFRVAYGDRPFFRLRAVTLPWEIDENLMRAELSPAEMAEHLAKREELWGQRSSGASCATGGGAPGENIGFASDTAAATGVSKATVNRATSRAKEIPGDIRLSQIGPRGHFCRKAGLFCRSLHLYLPMAIANGDHGDRLPSPAISPLPARQSAPYSATSAPGYPNP